MQFRKVLFAFLGLLLFANIAKSDGLVQNIASTTARVKIAKTIEITVFRQRVLRNLIVDFSITPVEGSSQVLLAGTVVSNNTGAPIEFIPIFFGSEQHLPRLAALTNARGEFYFNVCVSKESCHRLQTAGMSNATLYLEGHFNERMEMISSDTYIYSLSEFLKGVSK